MKMKQLEVHQTYSNYWYEIMEDIEEEKRNHFKWLFDGKLSITIPPNIDDVVNTPGFNLAQIHLLDFLREKGVGESYTYKEISKALIDNSIEIKKNKYKCSKIITKKQKESQKEIIDRIIKQIKKIIPMKTKTHLQNFKKQVELQTLHNMNLFESLDIANFFDQIKATNVYLSIDTADLMHGSTDSSFSSCLRVGGEYHEGASQYAQASFSMILRIVNENRLTGRQYIFVENGYLFYGKVYGTISDATQVQVRKYIQERYAKHLKLDNTWLLSRSDLPDNCIRNMNTSCSQLAGQGYIDLYDVIRVRHKTKQDPNTTWILPSPIDQYGNDWEGNQHYCSFCNENFDGEDFWVGDDLLCGYCADNHTIWCDKCDERRYSNVAIYAEDEWYCDQCADAFLVECDKCGSQFNPDYGNISDIEGENICDYCRDEYYWYCDYCDEYHYNGEECPQKELDEKMEQANKTLDEVVHTQKIDESDSISIPITDAC